MDFIYTVFVVVLYLDRVIFFDFLWFEFVRSFVHSFGTIHDAICYDEQIILLFDIAK